MPTMAAWLAVMGIAWVAGQSFPARAADEFLQFEAYSPLAEARELARRTQTPTTFDRLQRYTEASGRRVRGHSVDLAQEQFDVYLPREPLEPGRRFGLLVWISPHERMPAPHEWRNALDAHGMILVSARRSGNDHGTLERRLPLALHAVHGLAALHPIDPDRVYAGGFSGGSRAALRLAVGYPDVFRGALLASGSDVLGGGGISPPAAALMEALQARSRLVYVTGARDLPNRRMDALSRESMLAYCVHGVASVSMSRAEHAPPDRRHFARALAALDPMPPVPPPVADAGLAGCRGRLATAVDAALAEVRALLGSGEIDAAGERLGEVDLRWGGLAAPRSVELARELSSLRGPAGEDGR
jgi:hypothetical protein